MYIYMYVYIKHSVSLKIELIKIYPLLKIHRDEVKLYTIDCNYYY